MLCVCPGYIEIIYFFQLHSGLGSIIECVKVGEGNREALYLHECRLSKADMGNHIMGSFHRYNYIVSSNIEEIIMGSWCAALDCSLLTDGVLLDRKPHTPT